MVGAGLTARGSSVAARSTRCPGVAQDPEVKAPLLLMVIAGRTQRLQALDLGLEGLQVHDLRHTAGTLATAAGGSLREVMDRLGHSTTVAAVRYQHVTADRDAAIARELNRLLQGSEGR